MLFCSLQKGLTQKVGTLCFVSINSVLFNLLCVWILFAELFGFGINIEEMRENRLVIYIFQANIIVFIKLILSF